uniref:TNFR-Cys domain-containing protein n=1 Tax=Monopterus albus TaxID=43700 RepID=A0A3Q3Q0P2_MONAL|nr:tumor necrosis factor receptor superfamily member 4-like [Monopterus albus]
MVLLKLLIFTLTFYNLIVDLEARICPKGQRVTDDGAGCITCPDRFYQPEENDSQMCKPCTKCDPKHGSIVKQACTKETNTKCQCRGEFVVWDNDYSTCKCSKGFGLHNKECSKCEDGYFNDEIDKPCRKWKECKLGVNITGTKVSDVICNTFKNNPDITTPYTTRSTFAHSQEETQTQATRTTTTKGPAVTTVKKVETTTFSNTGNHIGVAILIFGIAGLLILTAVTCKLHIRPCMKKKTAVQKDSLCRRPVEESGSGCLSSLKLNAGEP